MTKSIQGNFKPLEFDSIADLREVSGNRVGQRAIVLGYTGPGDGGGGPLRIWKEGAAQGTYVDNGGSIIVPTSITDGSAAWLWEWSDKINLLWFGALTDGSDQSSKIITALTSCTHVYVEAESTFICKNIAIPSNRKLEIDGTLKLPDNSSDQDAIVKNSNVSNVIIFGTGTMDGNRSNQSGTISTEAVRLTTANKCQIFGLTVTSFYGSESAPVIANCINISGGSENTVRDIQLFDWSQEGIVLEDVQNSSVSHIKAIDNLSTSWSAVQMSGTTNTRNAISNIQTYNTGASAIGMDSTYSTLSDVIVDTVRFQSGINLGHTGQPSDYSVLTNIVVKNITDPVNVNSAGISVVSNTKEVTINNYMIDGSTQRGVNISDGAQNIKLSNGILKDCITALNIFSANEVRIDGFKTINCTNGINKDATTCYPSNIDLTGSTNKLSSFTSVFVSPKNFDMDTSVSRKSGVSIAALGAGGSVVVNNVNVLSTSEIIITPTNTQGAASIPFISNVSHGSFTVTTLNNGAAGAFLSYQII